MKYKWKSKNSVKMSIRDYVSSNLGEDAKTAIESWRKKYEKNAYSLVGLSRAVNAVKFRMTISAPIIIATDYDVDGKTGGAILYRTLKHLGYNNVHIMHSRPISEGYGLNMRMVDEIIQKFPESALVITVDNGITALDEVQKLVDAGIEVIVTDHHLPETGNDGKAILPNASVVIDANAVEGSADFNGICGAANAYKLSLKLLSIFGDENELFRKQLITLVALATVCDAVPMCKENYIFVEDGLKALSEGATFTGVNALLDAFNLTGCVTASDIGFKLGPALNADTRLYDDGHTALELLLTDDFVEACKLTSALKEINEERKRLVKDATAFAEQVVEAYRMGNDCPLFLNLGYGVKERLVGIVAGKLAEEYHTPCVCFAQTEGDVFKGSARSYGDVDIHNILDQAKDRYLTFGGHKAACGLSLQGLDAFAQAKAVTQNFVYTNGLRPAEFTGKEWDIEITFDEIPAAIAELKEYIFGEGNPAPVFRITGFKAAHGYKTLAYEGVKFQSDGVEAIGFGFSDLMAGHEPMDLVLYGSLSENRFRGKVTPQINFEDLEIISEWRY